MVRNTDSADYLMMLRMNKKYSNSPMIVSTHVFTSGPANALENYLRHRVPALVFVAHPFYYSNERSTIIRAYSRGWPHRVLRVPTINRFGIISYLRDFVLSVLVVIVSGRRFSLYIGLDSLNSLSGLVLRRLRLVREVVYYSIDYVPHRFENRLLNSMYHALDHFCARKCDWTWNLSPRMISERQRRGKALSRQLVVPIGSNFKAERSKDVSKVRPWRLVYLGSLRPHQGIDLVINSMPMIMKVVPMAQLVIIGSGPSEVNLRQRALHLGLEKTTLFAGRVESDRDVEEIVSSCGIGLALYEPNPKSFTQFTEPGKIKSYLSCGLPVITTNVPAIAKDLEQSGAGMVINYDATELISATAKFNQNLPFYRQARKAALSFAREYTWEKIFDAAFLAMMRNRTGKG